MGFSHMADKYRVTYDNSVEDAFVVHTNTGIIKFNRDGRLYTYEPSTNYLDAVAASKGMCDSKDISEEIDNYLYGFLVTKEGNRDGYTDNQYEDAKRAWKLYINTGGGGIDNFKHYLRQNIVTNCPVTNNDINRAQKIFMHDVGHLKGSTTRKTPKRVREEEIEIPRELIHQSDDLTLFLDLFYVNGLPMMTTIDAPIRNRSLVCLKNRDADSMYGGLDVILRSYNKAGYFIKKIRCDNEFRTLMNDIMDDLDIEIECVPQGDHVPEAERNNRTIGERIRAGYHRLPYRVIPKVMLETLAKISTRQLNFFPAKNGISPYFSPHMLMNKRNVDYNRHCKHMFGEYVQAYQEETIKNNNKPRTIDCIYLEPNFTSAGGHYVMNIATGAKMLKSRLWTVPITPTVIQAVESLAESQGYKTLKLLGKNKTRLLPSDWDEDEEYILMTITIVTTIATTITTTTIMSIVSKK